MSDERRDDRTDDRRDARGRQRGPARAQAQGHRTVQAPGERRSSGDPARTAAFDVLREVADSAAYANLALPPLLRHRGITGRDAAFATELAYGTLRLRGRYDAVIALAARRPVAELDPPLLDVLRLGVHQVLGMRVPAHAAVSETVALARARVGAGPAQLVNAVLRRVTEADLDTWLARIAEAAPDDIERLAVTQSHPAWIVRAMRQALVADGRAPEELAALLEADNDAPAVTLVARPGLADRAAVLRANRGSTPGRWTPTAVILQGGDPGAVPGLREGAVAVQDEGSQLVALALAAVPVTPLPAADGGPPERETWLDLCAGPGGKTGLLGAVAAGRGAHVVANELAPHRALLVERAVVGLPDGVVQVRCADGRTVGTDEPGRYDRVLVDAPCTGLGALRRRPESRWRRVAADLGPLGDTQRALLTAALDATRPGGVVAYVTCSPHPAETELVVKDVLKRRDDVVRLDAREAVRSVAGDIELGPGPGVQLWPHVHGTDAMHLTLLRRT
ncbi:transcription antitermination factor NusB [Actinotalea sp.]|uniref:RsmB/NOP family class I SAM-dependent RNA methyltransferase n=1 Tax=Actinotalea sp. TaxID=1872145 RepID=UPI002CB6BD43|nr:transcription antitermination factor NusB [Actinotalea sp.]HQY32669.1 transcription antitermination factor NusB [Actinotalea sp.]HRA50429.1 transcription antitermination factor NusB [Actinotalea sp.]